MDSQKTKQAIAKILKSVVNRFKYETFQAYITKLALSCDISAFVNEIFVSRVELKVLSTDIKEVLQSFAKEPELLGLFGDQTLFLWLEFEIIDHCSLAERLSEKEIDNYPSKQMGQLQFLKNIIKKYVKYYSEGDQKNVFKKVKQNTIYKQLEKSLKINESGLKSFIKKSKIVDISSIKQDDYKVICLGFLRKIVQTIGTVNEQHDCAEIQQNLKSMFESYIEKGTAVEIELLQKVFKEVILNLLHLEVTKNMCKIIQRTNEVLKESYNYFKMFFNLQKKIVQIAHVNSQITTIINQIHKILLETRCVWYWPSIIDETLIIFLRNRCISDKKKMQQLLEVLNKKQRPPNFRQKMYNLKRRQFLMQALNDVPNQSQRGMFIKWLFQQARNQQVDFEKNLQNQSNYLQIFEDLNLPKSKLQLYKSNIQTNINQFYIFDLQQRKKFPIYLHKEHLADLIQKIGNEYIYQKEVFTCGDYHFQCTINDQNLYGTYIKFDHYTQKQTKILGYLMFRNLAEYGEKLKDFNWGIIDFKGKKVDVTKAQSESICQKFCDAIKRQYQSKITAKIDSLGSTIQINLRSLQVALYSKPSTFKSRMKQEFGYLISIPSFKIKVNCIKQDEQNIDEALYVPVPPVDVYRVQQQQKYRSALKKQQTEQTCETDQLEENVENYKKVYKWLGLFSEYFDQIDGYKVTSENHIQATKERSIQYFEKWRREDLYRLMGKNVLKPRQVMQSTGNMSRIFKVVKRIQSQLKKEIKLIQSKASVEMDYTYNHKSEILTLNNMKLQKKARDLFQYFFDYITYCYDEQMSKKSFNLILDTGQQKYLSQIQIEEDFKILNKAEDKVEILCTRDVKQKIVEEVQALNEVDEFSFENVKAYELMKEYSKDFLQQINAKEIQRSQNTFKMAYKIKYHPQFKKRFKQYCQMYEQRPGQILQKRLQNQANFIQLYRSIFSFDPQIQVMKMGQDILIEYNSKEQKRVAKKLEQIQKEKQKQKSQILRRQGSTYQLKNVEPKIAYILKDKILHCLNQVPNSGVNAVLHVDYNQNGNYLFKSTQVNKQQEQLIDKLLNLSFKRIQQFKDYKQKLYDTNQYFNSTFNKIPSCETYNKKIKTMNNQLKKKLKLQLTEIIDKTTAQSYKVLTKQFQDYLKNGKYQSQFKPECIKKSQDQLKKEIEEMNIFGKYFNDKIAQAQKNSTVKKSALKDSIIKQMEQTTNNLQQKYKNGKIFPSNMKRFYKSLNILLTIYYGQQLPITAHLQQFKQKLMENDIVMVKVGTGSGKSTVIPPYLVGLGYKKVVVTQPRRLPCRQIYLRISEVFRQGVAGYEVADQKEDTNNSLIYMTDGLLKMRANFDQKAFDEIDVLVIDQIHQRSANIDLLLLKLKQYLEKPNRKLKLVLCSATIDEKIQNLFKNGSLKISSFFVQTKKFEVTQFPIKEGTIIDKILQLSKKLKPDQQMLVFIPGEAEVMSTVQILNKKFNKVAHPLTARCSERGQEKVLKQGRIFISTSIAQTSLTFKNLKYVIDSRRSRWRKFNPELQLMQTQESYSSKSSIQQRKGRLGRTCKGQYHYFEYHDNDFTFNMEHNVTELERVDLTNYIFQLLLSNNTTFSEVHALLKHLNHKPAQFQSKIKFSKQILQNSLILKKNGTLQRSALKMIGFGNLGNPLYNLVLFNASQQNCLVNMIYIVSFQMYGLVVAESMIDYCKKLHKGGDIKVIHDFLIDVGNKIDLVTIKKQQIGHQLKINCKQLASKPWFNVLIKIMAKAKDLLKASSTNLVAAPNEWQKILHIMVVTYKNKVFFNQSLFGGSKALYQKFNNDLVIDYESEKQNPDQLNVNYTVNRKSIIYQKGSLPDTILSLNCEINAMSECVLSICQEIKSGDIRLKLGYKFEGFKCQNKYFGDTPPLDEENVFAQIQSQVRSKCSNAKVDLSFPTLQLKGDFKDLAQVVKKVVQPKRRNKQVKVDLMIFLEDAIKNRPGRISKNKLAAVIDPDYSRRLFQRLDFEDYRRIFAAIKYEMKNKYDIEIEWDHKQRSIKIKNAKNIHLNKIITKISNFFTWFSDCQIISKEEYKIKPIYIGDSHNYSKDIGSKIQKVMDRVNQIVDSKLEHYILKGWVSGKGPQTKYPRTARMIAVCWVLVNCFNCTIKGGFVRDRVVNADEWLQLTLLQKVNLLQHNPRNVHRQVFHDKVTPSDIDAELPQSSDFDRLRFQKQMKKLGISFQIVDDGWRKHILFDDKTQSGGFTADLIQPYTALTHYTYDFDVNVMYIKKDYINSIGMKVPLEYQDNIKHTFKRVEINQLIELCMKKQMQALKNDMPDYRFRKFQDRGWSISKKELIQPICYKSLFTQSFSEPIENLKAINSELYQMIKVKSMTVVKIEQLRNKGWDDAFEAAQNWAIHDLERQEKQNNPTKYNLKKINSNNKVLFHGTKTAQGARGIKQSGFDSRFFSDYGMYGKGAYFADVPSKSHDYTGDGPLRYMFLVNIALGKQEVLTAADNKKLGPGKGYHSILGTAGSHRQYIIDRWGQAKPLFFITYK